jgi:hypothetical protein
MRNIFSLCLSLFLDFGRSPPSHSTPRTRTPPETMHLISRFIVLALVCVLVIFGYLQSDGLLATTNDAAPAESPAEARLDDGSELLELDLISYRHGFPPKYHMSTGEIPKYVDRNGERVPWYSDFAFWPLLERVRQRGWEMGARSGMKSNGMGSSIAGGVALQKKEVYRDVTGFVKGRWSIMERRMLQRTAWTNSAGPGGIVVSHDLPKSEQSEAGGILDYNPDDWGRNIMSEKGTINFQFHEDGDVTEHQKVKVRDVTAIVDITSQTEDWQVTLQGQHVVETGAMTLATSSYKWVLEFAIVILLTKPDSLACFRFHCSLSRNSISQPIKSISRIHCKTRKLLGCSQDLTGTIPTFPPVR